MLHWRLLNNAKDFKYRKTGNSYNLWMGESAVWRNKSCLLKKKSTADNCSFAITGKNTFQIYKNIKQIFNNISQSYCFLTSKYVQKHKNLPSPNFWMVWCVVNCQTILLWSDYKVNLEWKYKSKFLQTALILIKCHP